MNLYKCKNALCSLCKGKKAPYSSFYDNKWFLNLNVSTHFTLLEFDFVNMTLGNYGQVETANSKTPLFIVASGTILIEHEIFDPVKETTKVSVSELWPVYCVSSIQICFLFTGQILQSGLRVESNKSGSTFHDKSGDAVLLATPNLQGNIQIVKTHILKHDVPNPVSFVTRHLDFETLHCCFGHVSDEIICHVLDNVEDVKKIHFSTQKYIYHGCTLGKIHQYSFLKNTTCSSKPLELIHLDLLELSTLSYSKYKWIITFLDDYFSFFNIAFLCKKSEATGAIKSIFQMWSNTTSHPVKRLHTDNGGEYVTSELQFFLREQEVIYETSTLYMHQ